MEKVEQTICIYICLSVKISISYFAWKALNKNPTACLPQISRIWGAALLAQCPPNPVGAQHGVGGGSSSDCGPTSLPHCWNAVGRGIGKTLSVFPLAFTAQETYAGSWDSLHGWLMEGHDHLPIYLRSFKVPSEHAATSAWEWTAQCLLCIWGV